MRKERAILDSFQKLGLSGPQAVELLTHKNIQLAQTEGALFDGYFDASDRPEGGDVIVWWNDLTKDSR